MTQASADSLTSSLDKLQLSGKRKSNQKQRPEPLDSWEDDDGTEDRGPFAADDHVTMERPTSSSDYPEPPPPTPASPSFSSGKTSRGSPYRTYPPYGLDGSLDESDGPQPFYVSRDGHESRPEKSTAVASRLIAAGIGQKAPRRTEDQRKYDQAVKVQEKRRRDQAKAEEERQKLEKERAKKAIWDD
ncbi:hypothetical protein EJ03DRAFT_24978 [Teratosphaeria nubilosa]|uniref:Uncharacterized protein n=1 Tax=Teratosphaeria nubilosa TaxID=161662 RepID=A0A6G1LGR7_9PEZI|nr:hypothetical protein EJ03DRAFT_24978 [Teratosphaeria nubilosa]